MVTSSANTNVRWSYTGDNSTKVFSYDNKIFVDSDLKAYLDGTLQTLTTHYTVSGAGTKDGGNVTFVTAPGTDVEVVIVSDVGTKQESDYVDGDLFLADVVEDDFDRRALNIQKIFADLARTLKLAESDAETSIAALPDKAARLGKALTFDPVTGAPVAATFADLPGDVVSYESTPAVSTAAGTAGLSDDFSRGDHAHPSPMMARGDILTGAAAGPGNPKRLAKGAANTVLKSDGIDPSWGGRSVKGGDIASASPLVIDTDGDYFDVTGTTGFSVMTVAANRDFVLQFDGACAITVGSGITLNNGGSNYTTAAGDIIVCQSTAVNTVTGWVLPANRGFTLATEQSTTSGTSVTFGSLPAGTTMIVINFRGVSFTDSSDMLVQIGDADGIEPSAYISTSNNMTNGVANSVNSNTAGFHINRTGAADFVTGTMVLTLEEASSFSWTATHVLKSSTISAIAGAGEKSLSAELTQLKISGGTFDAGVVNIAYL